MQQGSLQGVEQEVRIYKASYLLQSRVGSGYPDENIISRCQKVMDENNFDFTPMAREYLDLLARLIEKGRLACSTEIQGKIIEEMTTIAMHLKANAAVFHYPLVSRLAVTMLWLLESIDTLDEDALDIAQAHYDSLQTLIDLGIRDNGHQQGRDFEAELKAACERFFRKRKIDPQNVFYVEF